MDVGHGQKIGPHAVAIRLGDRRGALTRATPAAGIRFGRRFYAGTPSGPPSFTP